MAKGRSSFASSNRMQQRWREQGNGCEEMLLSGANHFSILDQFARPDGSLFRAARGIMEFQ